jgi:hypothetical protein
MTRAISLDDIPAPSPKEPETLAAFVPPAGQRGWLYLRDGTPVARLSGFTVETEADMAVDSHVTTVAIRLSIECSSAFMPVKEAHNLITRLQEEFRNG